MTAFVAKRNDGRSVWRVIYDEIIRRIDSKTLNAGEIIKHADLRNLLTSREQAGYYAAATRAGKELAKERSRALRPANGEGYCLVAGVAQVELGKTHKKKGERALKRAVALVKTSDRRLMTHDERNWADKVEGALVTQQTVLAMHEERLHGVEAAFHELRSAQMTDRQRQSATADELAELRRRIEQIEVAKV